MAATEGEDRIVEALNQLRDLLEDARTQTQHALSGLSATAAEASTTGSGAGLAAVAAALAVAQAWSGRCLALAEAIDAVDMGAQVDDPAAPADPALTAPLDPRIPPPAVRAGLRLLMGGAEQQDVQLPAGGGEVVAIPQHLAAALGVQPAPEAEAEEGPAVVETKEIRRFPGLSERASAITHIRNALRQRSGKAWSVKGDRGTAYGWISISAPPSRQVDDMMTAEDAKELHELLAMGGAVRPGEISVEPQRRLEFVRRALGEVTHPYYPGAGAE